MDITIGAQGRTHRGNWVNSSLRLEKKAEDATDRSGYGTADYRDHIAITPSSTIVHPVPK